MLHFFWDTLYFILLVNITQYFLRTICWGVIRIFLQAIWFEKGETVQSNILRPQLRGRVNKCPRLFHPTFGLIHSEYGVGLSETNPIRSHYLLLKIEEPHLVKRDTPTVTN